MYGFGVISSLLAQISVPAPIQNAALSSIPSGGTAGCVSDVFANLAGQPSTNVSMTVNGHPRWFLVHVPKTYKAGVPSPVVLSFHGNLKTAPSQEILSGFSDREVLAVYPQGAHNSWEGPNYAKPWAHDLTFTTQILEYMRQNFCVKDNSIYATGKSNGGGFVGTLACSPIGGNFAAFAPVSGAYYTDNGGDIQWANCTPPTNRPCKPASGRQIPILEIHGSADHTIPYGGGAKFSKHDKYSGTVPPIPEYLTTWAGRFDCPHTHHNKTTSPPEYKGQVQLTQYGCGDLVQGYEIDKMGHCWPWTVQNPEQKASAGCGPTAFNATDLIMSFFGRHTKP